MKASRYAIFFYAALTSANILLAPGMARAQAPTPVSKEAIRKSVQQRYESLFDLYRHFHSHPELSFREEKTAAKIAAHLRQRGFEVTEKIGGHGVAGILRNGPGPTILVRADMDALPVVEQTGLPYASQVRAKNDDGTEVGVMHACGHDIHMTVFLGTAGTLTEFVKHWQGTLFFIAQPAEERGAGARAMLADGLYERFGVPDYGIALHVAANLPAGKVSSTEGFALANVDSVDITIRGVGGHGAYPHTTKDPVVLAAQTVLALQTIVSREIPPTQPAVVTVGSIHGGSKHNIIPDEVKLQLTLRSYSDEVREQTIAAIKRMTHGLGVAAGLPEDRLPVVTVKDEYTPATYNNPELTRRLVGVFEDWLGKTAVIPGMPVMGGEDFGHYGRTKEKRPICMFRLGAVDQDAFRASILSGKPLPSLHSPLFAPDPEPTIVTGVIAMTAAVLDLTKSP